MGHIRATLDTGIAPIEDLEAPARAAGVDLSIVTVTDRELAAHSYAAALNHVSRVSETAVWDESLFDQAVFAGEEETSCLEDVLRITSNGSFPEPSERANLKPRQRNQLRDAIIFCAHVRNKNHIFVTVDEKGFVRHGRREKLQARYQTSIMTRSEFVEYLISRNAI